MTNDELLEVLRRLDSLDENERREVFNRLRKKIRIHDLEEKWNIPAEVILEAIARSQDITQRGIRGVIAELCFLLYVLDGDGLQGKSPEGDLPYDFLIADSLGPIKVQVKLQRLERGSPKSARQWRKSLPESWFVVETQKTRTGKKADGTDTRPYRFGEFDILAVSMHPSTNDWEKFMFTVGRWLLPRPMNPSWSTYSSPCPTNRTKTGRTTSARRSSGSARGKRKPSFRASYSSRNRGRHARATADVGLLAEPNSRAGTSLPLPAYFHTPVDMRTVCLTTTWSPRVSRP